MPGSYPEGSQKWRHNGPSLCFRAFWPAANAGSLRRRRRHGTPHSWSADGKGRHREDPDNAGQGFDAPDYGMMAGRIAVTAEHEIAPPPALTDDAHNGALREVRAKGGAAGLPTTKRTPKETMVGTY
jgi:hypothetical protein